MKTNSGRRNDYIVLIEPDDLIRGLLDSWLREAGYAVVCRTLARLAENRSREGAPRLIITDIAEPRDAATIIQSLREGYPSPILVLSARFRRGLGSSEEVARRLGVCRVLPKPFTRKELLSAVSESID